MITVLDKRLVVAQLAEQLYEDIKFVTQLNPMQIVDDDTARMYNMLLNEVRITFSNVDTVFGFEQMTPRNIKYKDAMIVTGQLRRLIALLMRQGVPPSPQRPKTGGGKTAGGEDSIDETSQVHDEELYGKTPPPTKNPDGTIPFSMG